jgi:hypothetical protein
MEPETKRYNAVYDYVNLSNHFKLEKTMEQNTRKFWMITGDGNSPKIRHYMKQEALTEAKRLAKAYPGIEFYVLEAMEMMTQPVGFVHKKL